MTALPHQVEPPSLDDARARRSARATYAARVRSGDAQLLQPGEVPDTGVPFAQLTQAQFFNLALLDLPGSAFSFLAMHLAHSVAIGLDYAVVSADFDALGRLIGDPILPRNADWARWLGVKIPHACRSRRELVERGILCDDGEKLIWQPDCTAWHRPVAKAGIADITKNGNREKITKNGNSKPSGNYQKRYESLPNLVISGGKNPGAVGAEATPPYQDTQRERETGKTDHGEIASTGATASPDAHQPKAFKGERKHPGESLLEYTLRLINHHCDNDDERLDVLVRLAIAHLGATDPPGKLRARLGSLCTPTVKSYAGVLAELIIVAGGRHQSGGDRIQFLAGMVRKQGQLPGVGNADAANAAWAGLLEDVE